jgi:hypothetical protein
MTITKTIAFIEYDETLQDFLLQNNFNAGNIIDICKFGLLYRHINRRYISDFVKDNQNSNGIGCIFTLPDNREDDFCFAFYSPMSSDEIRRTVAMKVFL